MAFVLIMKLVFHSLGKLRTKAYPALEKLGWGGTGVAGRATAVGTTNSTSLGEARMQAVSLSWNRLGGSQLRTE